MPKLMTFIIREAKREEMAEVLELIKELAAYEKASNEVEIGFKDLEEEGFDKGNFKCFIAVVEGKIEGMALVYFRFSTWKGRTLYLEDLYVRESMRGKGLGSVLYQKVVEYAYENGVKRVEWVVSAGNKNAIKFYEKTGANLKKDWYIVHLDESEIRRNIKK